MERAERKQERPRGTHSGFLQVPSGEKKQAHTTQCLEPGWEPEETLMLSTNGHWHQHQQESPIWGVVKKEILFSAKSSIVMQHVCEDRMTVEQLSSATAKLLNSVAVEQHCSEVALVVRSPWGEEVLGYTALPHLHLFSVSRERALPELEEC